MVSRFRKKAKSASKAKDRLRMVLIHDRINLPPGKMDQLRDELIDVISRHIDIDHDAVRIEFAQEGREQRLLADIPLQQASPRRRGR